ncbi:unnamed protein product [Cladocopium goreaui]|uniref:Tyrosine-protein kinase ephrin type A/B receptor-like domain-containing protein n=3 Tax=Cladocopium goreaui TaxID=2562237 RepID=A0A9P1G6D9_9DINO|nr:unnamed protein product [Cladocopium goreaui]
MGYQGISGQYISHEVIETAYAQEGLTLVFYRSHNASWTNPSRYFDNISAFNTENIKFCNETRLMNSKAMEQYARVTGDWDGIDNSSGTVVGKCFQGHYWFAPVCRANPMTCYPVITAGPGYAYEHFMQRAAVFNMPVVMVVAKLWSDYIALPTQVKSSFYWWEPDPTFLSLDAHKMIYPDFDSSAHRAGILTTDYEAVSIDKYASADLKALAPEVYEVLSQFNMDLKTVNKLTGDQADTGDAPEVVACRWLQANKDHWESWLPDKTKCFPQFGLYDELTGQFVQDRSDPTSLTCRVCASGFYSSHLKDDAGVTYVCKPCAPGSAQPSGAALKCEPCPTGEYQDKNGSTSCKRCGQGKYQDAKGQTQCKECPAATTTLGLGSASVFECGCEPGRINIANETDLPKCTPCGEGLSCPFSSSLETLKLGTAPLGEQYQPALRRGFYCTMDSPLVVFKCVEDSFCPGGVPEVCSGGRVGMICAECPTGMTWTGSECTACDPSTSSLWWCCVLLFFCALIGGYYIMNPKIDAIATARQTWGVSVGLAIMWLQTVAIIAMMTVEWPSSVSGSLSVMHLFILDVDSLSFSCIASDQASARYIAKVLVFPTAMAWMCALFFISKCLPKSLQWRPATTANTIGHYMQASFAIMSTVALQSMTCYVHPNGSYSLVKYSSITCGEGEQATMMAAGVSLLIVCVVGFLAIATYATVALPSWSSDRMFHHRVQSFNFLTFRFRLDKWWFGIPLLLRGPLMSLVVTCATNFPAAQVCLNSLILTIYIVIQ